MPSWILDDPDDTKLLIEPLMIYHQLVPYEQLSMKF